MTANPQLPCWPRGLCEPLAAAYCGISETSFRTEVREGRAPRPIRITRGRQIWDRSHLDQWIDQLGGRETMSPKEVWDRALE
jgi:prophage regulatory protein